MGPPRPGLPRRPVPVCRELGQRAMMIRLWPAHVLTRGPHVAGRRPGEPIHLVDRALALVAEAHPELREAGIRPRLAGPVSHDGLVVLVDAAGAARPRIAGRGC